MGQAFDKIVDTATRAGGAAVKATGNLIEKGRNQANRMALQSRLAKMQRQLGALVYALRKNGEENSAMLDWYVDEIDRIKSKLAIYETEKQSGVTVLGGETAAEGSEDAMFCGCGGH